MKPFLIILAALSFNSMSFAGGGTTQPSDNTVLSCAKFGPVLSIEFQEDTRSARYQQWVEIKFADGSNGILRGQSRGDIFTLDSAGRITGFHAKGVSQEEPNTDSGHLEYAFASGVLQTGKFFGASRSMDYNLELADGSKVTGKVFCGEQR